MLNRKGDGREKHLLRDKEIRSHVTLERQAIMRTVKSLHDLPEELPN